MKTSLFRAALFALTLLGAISACQAGGRIEGVYLSSLLFRSGLDHNFTVLYSDGRALNVLPPGGIDEPDFAALDAKNPKEVGRWRESGGQVTVEWGGGRERSTYPRRPDGSLDLQRGISTRLTAFPDGQRIQGVYRRTSTAGGQGTFLASTQSLAFAADGSYGGKATASVAARGVGKAASSADGGSYAIKGYTLELRHGDGRTSRHFLATSRKEPADKPKIIYLDGGHLLLEDDK